MSQRIHAPVQSVMACLLGMSCLLAAPAALAQGSPLDTLIQMHSGPDEYYFFEDDRKKIVDYKQPRVVRVCAGKSRHLVPLMVTYDDSRALLASGDCIRVEAQEVYLEPAEPLDDNWLVKADVQTVE